jgi:23S rRNA pseudouridine1911/1915/1917 synthase
METRKIMIENEDQGQRIDKLIALKIKELSRSRVQKLIEDGQVLLDGSPCKPNTKVKAGSILEVAIPEPEEPDLRPEEIPLDIIYEDRDLLVLNKPQGLVVHPAPGNQAGTLVNALLNHCRDLSGINGTKRPGIVHRLDKDTSGALVVAKNDFTHHRLAAQLKERKVSRTYWALVHGNVGEEGGRIDAPIGRHPVHRKKMAVVERNAKPAITEYRVKERFQGYTLVEVNLHTGRTHQIRVHMAYIKHPVVGDPVYGPKYNPFGLTTQVLHAYRLSFVHPRKKVWMEFEAPLPGYFQELLLSLRLGGS